MSSSFEIMNLILDLFKRVFSINFVYLCLTYNEYPNEKFNSSPCFGRPSLHLM
jgi:hypothetical protein